MVPSGLAAGLPSASPSDTAEDGGKIDTGLREKLLALPDRSSTRKGQPSDAGNLAFMGSAQQIEQAFLAAGWTYGDSVSTWSVLREMRALSVLNSYPHLPISNHWLSGEAPDFTWQKTL